MNRTSKHRQLFTLFLFFTLAVAMLGQGENRPFFQLSSYHTAGSGENPTVQYSAWNVDALEFRVYRIHDPVRFFQQLDQAHQFGGSAKRPSASRAPIEEVRQWKRTLRANIRRALRAQFTESPSKQLNNLVAAKSVTPGPAASGGQPAKTANTQYAEAPLLNPDQLVLTYTEQVHSTNRWTNHETRIPVTDQGVYLVEAVNHDLRAYTVVFVSDLVLISKPGRNEILNFVVDRKTGQPVANVPVSAMAKGDVLATLKSDAEGIAQFHFAPKPDTETTLIAANGRNFAATTLHFQQADNWMGYIYTDRPVYRPGHIVHFKAMLRLRTPEGFNIAAGKKVQVTVNDPAQKPAYQKTLEISPNGTLQDDFTLPAGAALGNYFVQIQLQQGQTEYEGWMTSNFDVEAYKKPEYEVRVTPSQTRVIQGGTVQAVIDARYFFGEPVSGAKVKYSIARTRYWFPFWYDADDEQDQDRAEGINNDDEFGRDQLTDQEGQLDADGKLTVEIPATVSEKNVDVVYHLEAHVTDKGNREVIGRGGFIATYGSFLLNVTPDRYVYSPGQKVTATIQARTYDNEPTHAKVHARLLQWDRHHRESKTIAEQDSETDSKGNAATTFTLPQEGGSFTIEATAPSQQGREVSGSTWLWISGDSSYQSFGEEATIQIIPDKKTYKPGETAKLLIDAGRPGATIYMTVEGRDLRTHKLLRSNGSSTFDVPIDGRYEPGITVVATSVSEGVVRTGQKYLRIPPAEHQLNVRLATDKPQYKPGDVADYSLNVTDNAGRPVPKAEFSLGVVDEAIYGVRPDTTQDIQSFFFARDYNRIFTQNSLEFMFSGTAGKLRMQLADLRPRSRLAQLKPERLVMPKVRKAFPDTAFWTPTLVTDADGHAHAKVEYPDTLTTWRATARGITASTSVGNATLKTIVRKNLIIRLVTPRFFTEGDEVTISALVHNYLTDTKKARVSLDVKGLTVLSGATQDVTIPSRGEAKVDWRVKPVGPGTVTITGKALTDEESDALEMDLPVNFRGIRLDVSKGGSISAGASSDFDIVYPADITPGSRTLSLRVAPSITGSLFSALDYLTSFPYGCVEQTMSSFLPDIEVREAVHSLGLKTDLNEGQLNEKIQAGLDRLQAFEHQDGGWGWWETDETHPFMTAYVVAGLVQARNAGTHVPQEMIRRGAAWLKKDLASNTKLRPDVRAYMFYALSLAGQIDGAGMNDLYDHRGDLTPYGAALLGLALENAKDGRAADLASSLESRAAQDDTEASWPASRDPLLDFEEDATPEATAFVMRFLSHEKKDSPVLPKAALWLVNHRNEGYWWSSTKQTAMVIYGLIDYLKATQELSPNNSVTISVNGKQVLAKQFDQAGSINPPDTILPDVQLQPGVNHIHVTSSGKGRIYFGARAEYFSTAAAIEKSGPASLKLTREYFRLVSGKSGDKIVYDTAPLNGPVSVGDVLAVRVSVTGSEWKYAMLEDPIPAGTEFIEKDQLYELRSAPPWWERYFDRREMHDDHLAIFQEYFPKGNRNYVYLLKVVNSGVFQINPARFGPMYQTDISATTDSRTLEVK